MSLVVLFLISQDMNTIKRQKLTISCYTWINSNSLGPETQTQLCQWSTKLTDHKSPFCLIFNSEPIRKGGNIQRGSALFSAHVLYTVSRDKISQSLKKVVRSNFSERCHVSSLVTIATSLIKMLSNVSWMASVFKFGWSRFETYSQICNKHLFRWL